MTIYIILFILLAIIATEYEFFSFKKEPVLLGIIIFLSLFAGFRAIGIDNDYGSYQNNLDIIYELSTTNDGVFLPLLEPGYILIALLSRSLFIYNYGLAVMLFFAFTSITIKISTFNRYSKNPFIIILLYYSNFFLLHEMTQIRIGLAVAILFISLYYYFKNEIIICICLILLATLFHYSAILYLLLLFLDLKSFNKIFYSLLILLGVIFSFVKLPFLNVLSFFDPASISGRVSNYAMIAEKGLSGDVNFLNTITISNILCCAFFLIFIPTKVIISDKVVAFFLKSTIFSIFIFGSLVSVPSVSFRFGELFSVGSFFLYGSLTKYLPFKKANILVVIILAGIFLYINIFHQNLLRPYEMINIK